MTEPYDYLAQMHDEANRLNVDILKAVRVAGIHSSTWWRWNNGISPSESVTRRVFAAIGELANEATHGG